MSVPPLSSSEVPAEILRVLSACRGQAVIVLGAGCSSEPPTNLRLSRDYSEDIHRRLVLDGILEDGDCADPGDLSAVTSAVWAKEGSQRSVVDRLPRPEFRTARPNDGYLIAAALLRERAISCVLTLNFDLAMSSALTVVSAAEVDVIRGPDDLPNLGATTVIYLHRNVDELDPERWILRQEALEDEWHANWEEVVARRVMAAPVTIFAGLGSPAAVLTETIRQIRAAVTEVLQAYVVDPGAATAFQVALDLSPEAHIRLGWSEFMKTIASRLVAEHASALEQAALELCNDNGWDDEIEHVPDLCGRFGAVGLITSGKIRATWLLDGQGYRPDDDARSLIADLLLGVGLVERALGTSAFFRDDGVVEFRTSRGNIVASVLVVSGRGTRRWAALEPRVRAMIDDLRPGTRPALAILGGVQEPTTELIPPENVVGGERPGDIISAEVTLKLVAIDSLREHPSQINELTN